MMPPLIACRDCGAVQTMPQAPRRGRISCWRCGRVLEHTAGRSVDAALACAIATLLLLVPANFVELMTVHAAGISSSTHLASGLLTFWRQGWPLITLILGAQGIVLPFLRFGLLAVTLGSIRSGRRDRWLGPAFRWCEWLDDWAMADVLFIGFGVGYGRVASQIPVRIDAGGWCFVAAAMMSMVTRASMDRRAIWQMLGAPALRAGLRPLGCTSCDLVLPPSAEADRCPRCGDTVHRRIPQSLPRTTALVIACWVLLPIAYILPMSEFWEAGTPSPHSIPDGVWLLFTHGFWEFGILITVVSIGIPLTKLTGLTWFLVSIHRGSAWRLRGKTRLYRFIDETGRWSNLDPFTVMIFAPMVQLGQLAHISVVGGSLAFLSLVVLSMIAAKLFDPRLLWDAAVAARHRLQSGRLVPVDSPPTSNDIAVTR